MFRVSSFESAGFSFYNEPYIKIVPTRLSYKFRGGDECARHLSARHEWRLAKQSREGESRERKRRREETITEWRFQTRTTSIPRPTSETAREGCVYIYVRFFFPPWKTAWWIREAAGPNCFCVELKKINDLYRAISVAQGGAHEIIGKISAR